MPSLQEGELTFDFPDEGSDVAKYDEWSFFRNQFQKVCGRARARVADSADLEQKLKQLLKPIDPHPRVVDRQSPHPSMRWTVT